MMQSQQCYISKELTHLVGNEHVDDLELQYLKLCRILKKGYLTYSPEKSKEDILLLGIGIKPGAKLSENEMITPTMVCFCDIPVNDLKIHTQKYGYLGLSFSKDFIVRNGGSPVFYIPKQTTAKKFDEMWPEIHNVFGNPINNIFDKKTRPKHIEIFTFMLKNIFSYLQSFDHKLPEEDKENYYFEREWRLLGSLKFTLKDIEQIFLPESYAKEFREEFHEYYGQVTFTRPGVQRPRIKVRICCQKCGHEREVRVPENTTVSLGIVSDQNRNYCGERICVSCGCKDVSSAI